MLTATAPTVLSPEVDKIIFDSMRQADIDKGIGYLDRDDVRAHLQECAIAALQRFDPCRGASVKTFLWRRLHGAAIELVRVHGTRKRTGVQRPQVLSMDHLAWDPLDSARRSRDRQALRTDEPTDPTDQISDIDAGADLLLAVASLPVKMRLVLALLFYEQLTVTETASRLHQPEETVRALRDGAIVKLRRALSPLTSIPPRAETKRYDRPNGRAPLPT